MTTPEPYKIPRGRPANPFCPTCLQDPLLKDRPHKRVAPGRKCQIHERSYMADYNRKWARRNALRNERVRLEVELYQYSMLGETIEELLATLGKLRAVEKELIDQHGDHATAWPVAPSQARAARVAVEQQALSTIIPTPEEPTIVPERRTYKDNDPALIPPADMGEVLETPTAEPLYQQKEWAVDEAPPRLGPPKKAGTPMPDDWIDDESWAAMERSTKRE